MPSNLDTYLRLCYAVQVIPEPTTEGGLCYLASHPELPGCMSHGATVEEATANLELAKRLYIETLLSKGVEVPLPVAATAAGSAREVVWSVVGPTSMKELMKQEAEGAELETGNAGALQVEGARLTFVSLGS